MDNDLSTDNLLRLSQEIDHNEWYIGWNGDGQEEGTVWINAPERGAIAIVATNWVEDGKPIPEGMADAEAIAMVPELIYEVLRLRKENECLHKKRNSHAS